MKKESDLRFESFPYKTETEFESGKFDVYLEDATYIVFDLETTGGNPSRNGITEIAAIKYSHGKVQDIFYSLVNPRIPIPPIVQRMTGITNQTVRNAPLIDTVFPPFLEFIGNDVLISHNTVGDMTFLVHYARTVCRHKLTNFFLCTHLLAEKTVHDAPNYSLSGLGVYLKLPSGGKSHRAEADAQMTLQLFLEIKRRMQADGVLLLRDALRYQGHVDTGLRLGLALDEKSFAKVMTRTGVLALYDHKGAMLFAGSSSHVRRELQSLHQLESLPRRFLKVVLHSYHFHTYPASNLFTAMLKEAELLCKHKFSFDPIRWHGRSLSMLYVLSEKDGALQIGIGSYPYSVLPIVKVFGPVTDTKATQNKLKILCELFEGTIEKKVLWVAAEKSRLLSLLFAGKIEEELENLRRERFKLSNLLSLANQRKLSAEIQAIKVLSSLDILDGFTDLSSVNGVLILPNEEGSGRELYPIVQSHVMKAVVIEAGKNEAHYEELYRKSAHKFHPTEGPSELDILRTNAMLWMIMVGIKKKHSECQFIPIE
jgi:DNA polymerase-3 subunit epsilon